MRMVLNILILVMVTMLLGGMLWRQYDETSHNAQLQQTRDDVARLQRVIMLHAALNNIERSSRGYPMTVDPEWFDGDLPLNPLLSTAHPWLEIAHPDHYDLHDPPMRVAGSKHYARFWYNPALGIVRARVPRAASDAATLRLYNAVNGTTLTSLYPEPVLRRDEFDDEQDEGEADPADGPATE